MGQLEIACKQLFREIFDHHHHHHHHVQEGLGLIPVPCILKMIKGVKGRHGLRGYTDADM